VLAAAVMIDPIDIQMIDDVLRAIAPMLVEIEKSNPPHQSFRVQHHRIRPANPS
jgi:hypothetical protein